MVLGDQWILRRKKHWELFQNRFSISCTKLPGYTDEILHLFKDGRMYGSDNRRIWYANIWPLHFTTTVESWDRNGELIVIDHEQKIYYHIKKANGRRPK